jgi:DNA-directed RNA polymerase subunit RPC12/RpoP
MNEVVVRCPYCVAGLEFRPMAVRLDGKYVCSKCGHLVAIKGEDSDCSCPKCLDFRALDERRWRDLFQDVLLAPDNPALEECIKLAQQAIDKRIREGKVRAGEREQICEALQTLKLLRLKLDENKRKVG